MAIDTQKALFMAKHYRNFRLPDLAGAQQHLEENGYETEALSLEEYLMDQSDEAWEACGVKPG